MKQDTLFNIRGRTPCLNATIENFCPRFGTVKIFLSVIVGYSQSTLYWRRLVIAFPHVIAIRYIPLMLHSLNLVHECARLCSLLQFLLSQLHALFIVTDPK